MVEDQDQDFAVQDQDQDLAVQDQDNFFTRRGASRPRPKPRGLQHWRVVIFLQVVQPTYSAVVRV